MADKDLDTDSRVIRLFPGYAGTVLWAWSGTIEYEESRLSGELIAALRGWEALGEQEGLTDVPLSKAAEAAWLVDGETLARAIATELGSGFSVAMDLGPQPLLLNSHEPPTNPAAFNVFESQRLAAIAEHTRRRSALAGMSPDDRASFRWVPLKGRPQRGDAG